VSVLGKVEHVERLDKASLLIEGVLDDELSSFRFSLHDGILFGDIRPSDGTQFQVVYLGAGLYEIRELDPNAFPSCGVGPSEANFDDRREPSDPRESSVSPETPMRSRVELTTDPDATMSPLTDPSGTIDVLVVFTPAAKTAVGGDSAIRALINLAITETNQAYYRSQISTRVRLVAVREVAYRESSSFSTDLDRLTGRTDGFMDSVHALRNSYGADLVSLITNNDALCGLAWQMTSVSTAFRPWGFSVVNWSCATGNYTFAHELAHNQGSAHDRANADLAGAYPNSYGWRFYGASGRRYRTIMAYEPGARIQRFSNPNVLYDGVPTGVQFKGLGANNASSINRTASTVANFRLHVVP
jgi:hypothetical protein